MHERERLRASLISPDIVLQEVRGRACTLPCIIHDNCRNRARVSPVSGNPPPGNVLYDHTAHGNATSSRFPSSARNQDVTPTCSAVMPRPCIVIALPDGLSLALQVPRSSLFGCSRIRHDGTAAILAEIALDASRCFVIVGRLQRPADDAHRLARWTDQSSAAFPAASAAFRPGCRCSITSAASRSNPGCWRRRGLNIHRPRGTVCCSCCATGRRQQPLQALLSCSAEYFPALLAAIRIRKAFSCVSEATYSRTTPAAGRSSMRCGRQPGRQRASDRYGVR